MKNISYLLKQNTEIKELTELLTEIERDENFLRDVEEKELVKLNHILALLSEKVSDKIF